MMKKKKKNKKKKRKKREQRRGGEVPFPLEEGKAPGSNSVKGRKGRFLFQRGGGPGPTLELEPMFHYAVHSYVKRQNGVDPERTEL